MVTTTFDPRIDKNRVRSVGSLHIEPSTSTTVVDNLAVGSLSMILLIPRTENALILYNRFIDVQPGVPQTRQFTLTHFSDPASLDLDFDYVVFAGDP